MLALALRFAVVALAQAEVPTATLEYVRDPGAEHCPDERRLKAEVAARLGHEPFRDEANVHLLARLYRSDALRARIEMRNGSGPVRAREIASDDTECGDLFDSVVLAISLSVDPLVLAKTRRPTLIVQAPPEPAPFPKAPGRARFDVALGAASTFGVLPGITFGPAFAMRGKGERFSLGIEATASLRTTWRVGPGRVDGSALLGAATGCVHEGPFSGCGVFSGGALEWVGLEAGRIFQPWLAAGARAEFEWPRESPWSVRVHGQLMLPFIRTVLVGDSREFWHAPAWAVGAGAVVVRRFR